LSASPIAPSAASSVEITVVMPCLNEVQTLPACIAAAKRGIAAADVSGEILIADNGSSDGSREIAAQLGARVVRVGERGYGAAVRGGIAAARGRYVVMGDADGSYDFSRLGPFVDGLRGGAELVMGNRFRGRIEPGAMPWKNRYIGNPVLTLIGRVLFGAKVGDFHCGLRALTRELFERLDLRATGMELASEMVIKASLHGEPIAEVPITLHPDGRSRPPHLRPWRDGWRHLRFMLLFSPAWLFVAPGLVASLGGTALGAWLLGGSRRLGPLTLDIHTLLVAAVTVLVGHQLLVFGSFAKRFAVVEGLHPDTSWPSWLPRDAPWLEIGAIVGVLLCLAGLGSVGWAVDAWRDTGFAALEPRASMRRLIPGVVLAMLGVQTLFGSFFLGVLGLKHRLRAGGNRESLLPPPAPSGETVP
jgi:hypothetical protein